LRWLDPPGSAALDAARSMLVTLHAIDTDGRITALGRRMRALPLPAPLARMLLSAGEMGAAGAAAEIAAVIVERGLGGPDTDLEHRLVHFRRDRGERATQMRRMADGWAKGVVGFADVREPPSTAALLALAYPDRIAKARGGTGQFLLAGGRGAYVDATDPLARAAYLVVAEMSGRAAQTRILLAAAFDEQDLEGMAGDRLLTDIEVAFDMASARLKARRVRRLGAIVLEAAPLGVPITAASVAALAAGLAALGADRLPWTRAQTQLRDRVAFLRSTTPGDWPDLGDEALTSTLPQWLAPFLSGKIGLADVTSDDLGQALDLLVPWDKKRRLEADAPTHYVAPTGNSHAIRYDGAGAPALAIRVQELFGLTQHPSIAGGRLPLTLELLSPAQRPIQITRDLPGFWAGSWREVKAEMRGRYPRHVWPDDPASALPTARAKPRGT
jgi:ATP-dependent helicase HrpB